MKLKSFCIFLLAIGFVVSPTHAQRDESDERATPTTGLGRALDRGTTTIAAVDAQMEERNVILDAVPFDEPLPTVAQRDMNEPMRPADEAMMTADEAMETSDDAMMTSDDTMMTADEIMIEDDESMMVGFTDAMGMDEQVELILPDTDQTRAGVSRTVDTISVDFPQEDVRAIITSVADLYELNVVIPEALVGTVSLKLRNVTWQQVFNVVLEQFDFTYVEEDNIIKIKSLEELLAEPLVTRVFIVDFARASEIQAGIQPLIGSSVGGLAQVDARSNALIISERPSRMSEIQRIIEALDRPTDQVMIESKFIEVTRADQLDLGVDWSALSGYTVSAGPFARTYDRTTARSRTEGSTNDTSESLAVDSAAGTSNVFGESSSDQLTNSLSTALTRGDTAVFNADAFAVVLNALEQDSAVELISNPTVVTMNNQEANILVGEEYPIPDFTFNQERGTFDISGFEYTSIGIQLNVTPQVNSAGFITMDIEPTVNNRTGEVTFDGATLPILASRSASATVTIKSGFTLAIGGLVERDTSNSSNQVPVLGDIPVLGRLFRNSSRSTDVTSLVIFITARVLSATGATYRDVFSPRTLFDMGISERDVPGVEIDPSEQALYDQIQAQRAEMDRLENQLRLQRQINDLRTEREDLDREEEEEEDEPRIVPRRFQ